MIYTVVVSLGKDSTIGPETYPIAHDCEISELFKEVAKWIDLPVENLKLMFDMEIVISDELRGVKKVEVDPKLMLPNYVRPEEGAVVNFEVQYVN
ncbi:hypothetical protein GGH94_004079 [Coemansia aciculifera]|uniref:Uncharacterized protein n=1 Tax=Coemansia aciculifera TaxID=417176 RepID=A0A9W8IG44_9FUNG|nr:hypothetical protein GGH94_004079 [Coemansia aciculifera]